jgi:putative ABC transport system permease protein
MGSSHVKNSAPVERGPRRHRRDDELRQELETHLALIQEEGRANGLTAAQADREARSRFGSPLSYRERAMDAVVVAMWLEHARRDLLFAARRLRRAPAFTMAAVLTLALAIGANASIFTIVHRVVLNPLPYPESNQVIDLDHAGLGVNVTTGIQMSPGLYFTYLDRARTLEGVALYWPNELTLTDSGGEPERLRIAHVTPSLAPVLRVWPLRGRWFADQEGTIVSATSRPVIPTQQVAVVSYRLWMRRYGGDPSVLSRSVAIEGVPTQVIGIMPPSFAFPDPRVDIWLALQQRREIVWDSFNYAGVARVRPGATVADARAELNGLIADLPRAYPNDPGVSGFMNTMKVRSAARTLQEATVARVERALWILLASVGLVLLVACANVANLFLVRSDARRREVAVRRALGAGRLAVARFFFAESALLSMAGALVGLGLAWGVVRLLVAIGPTNLPRLGEVRLDWVVVAYTLGLSAVAAAAFGVIPLWHGAPLSRSLHESGRGNTTSRIRHRARHLMMGGQVALALVLLVSSGLMVRSFQKLRAIDPGYDASSALSFRVGLPASRYPTQQAIVAAHRALIERLSALPGVTAASASTCPPLAEEGLCFGSIMRVDGRALRPGEIPPLIAFRAVAGDYLDTLGVRVIRGRSLSRADDEHGEAVAVINQLTARYYFPNQDPIGQRVTVGPPMNRKWLTIVGVVANTPTVSLTQSYAGQMFLPMSISGTPDLPVAPNAAVMSYVVRTAVPPSSVAPAVRRAVDAVDKNLALAQVRTLQDVLDRASAQMAFTMVLLAIAAGVALLLGVIGIYGVMSYVVSQRTGEIGVRLALGAEPGEVARMIVRQGGIVAGAGVAIGLAAAVAGSRLIESLLYDVGPRDPGVFFATTLTLLAVALAACWLPARRAARLSPIEALRTE